MAERETEENKESNEIIGQINGNEYTSEQLYDFLDDCSMRYKDYLESPIADKRAEAKEFRKRALQGIFDYISSNGYQGNFKERLNAFLSQIPDKGKAKGNYHEFGCVYNSASLEEALKNCLDIKMLSLRAYARWKTKKNGDALLGTVREMVANKEYNPQLLYDFVDLNEELKNLRNAGITNEFATLTFEGKPIEDEDLYTFVLGNYVMPRLETIKNRLSREKGIVAGLEKNETPFSEEFFANHSLRDYEFLKDFVARNITHSKNPEKLQELLNQCDEVIAEAGSKFVEDALRKHQLMYNHAMELAQKLDPHFENVLELFKNFTIKYGKILDESIEDLHEDLQEVYRTFNITNTLLDNALGTDKEYNHLELLVQTHADEIAKLEKYYSDAKALEHKVAVETIGERALEEEYKYADVKQNLEVKEKIDKEIVRIKIELEELRKSLGDICARMSAIREKYLQEIVNS